MMEAIIEKRNKIVEFFLNKNILITRDILNKINSEEHIEEFYDDLFNKKQEIVIDEFENQQQTTIQSPIAKGMTMQTKRYMPHEYLYFSFLVIGEGIEITFIRKIISLGINQINILLFIKPLNYFA